MGVFDIEGDPLKGLMSPTNGGGGWLSGLLGNPLVGGGLLSFGSSLLSGLGSLIGGPSQSEKRARQVYGLARGKYGKPVFDPNEFIGTLEQGLAPQFNADAQAVSKRLGLSSGMAQGELYGKRQAQLSEMLGQLKFQAIQLQEQRDQSLLAAMLQAAQMS